MEGMVQERGGNEGRDGARERREQGRGELGEDGV